MATTLDELLIKIRAEGGEAAEKEVRKTKKGISDLADTAMGVKSAFGGLTSTITGALSPIAGAVGMIGGAAAAGLGSLGYQAIQAAAQAEQLRATMGALYHSMDIGAQKVAWIKQFASTTNLEAAPLAAAAVQIEAAGMRIERVAPIMSGLAGAFGATQENVMELASAFSRLPSGQFGESMEIFRRFGVNASDLMSRGVKFNGGGQILSDWKAVMAAIEGTVTAKFGDIQAYMGGTFNQMASNFGDAWTQMLEGIGTPLLKVATDAIRVVSGLFDWITKSGAAERIGQAWAKMFNVGSAGEAAKKLVVGLVVALGAIPQILPKVREQLQSVFETVQKWLKPVAEMMVLAFGLDVIVNIIKVVGALVQMAKAAKATAVAMGVVAALSGPAGWRTAAGGILGGAVIYGGFKLGEWLDADKEEEKQQTRLPKALKLYGFDLSGRYDRLLAQMDRVAPSAVKPPVPDTGAWGNGIGGAGLTPPPNFGGMGVGALTPGINATARNTRETADGLRDLRAALIGGGRRGGRAASSFEVEMALARALGLGIG